MKKHISLSSAIFILILFFTSSICIDRNPDVSGVVHKTEAGYRDGLYEGRSRGEYINEPYWGIARLKI